MLNRRSFLASLGAAGASLAARGDAARPLQPFGAVPTKAQLAWHRHEMNCFLHFTVNTFTDKEWGYGDEDPNIFLPTDFDADAIVAPLKAAGFGGVILTCKHHDGFCLWPTRSTDHSVRHSRWMNGQGDVVRAISLAAARHGLRFGVYVSPWDRNNAAYGTPAYLPIYRQQLTELLTNYGPIFEVWFDGANGGDGFYGGAREKRTIDKLTYYDWPNTWALVRKLQPEAVMFSDAGPDLRWVGNERGEAGAPCWATIDPEGEHGGPASPGDANTVVLEHGTANGRLWMPAECDVSLRPGWFWHPEQSAKVKSPEQLMKLYLSSVGRGGGLLLNIPPDRRGQLDPHDLAALRGFTALRERLLTANLLTGTKLSASNVRGNSPRFAPHQTLTPDFDTFWATNEGTHDAVLRARFAAPIQLDTIRLREAIALGQRVRRFRLEALHDDGSTTMLEEGQSVGACRIITLPAPLAVRELTLQLTADAPPAMAEFAAFRTATG